MRGWLMRDPRSPFTNALAVFWHIAGGYVGQQNDCLRRVNAAGLREQRLTSSDNLADIFETVFDLDIPHVDHVWEGIAAIRRGKAA
ncbi:MAG: hypothetical protein P0Y64_00570 [Candidatus Sphingomonas colombiensis]|nr:hypothetical protein [Sphingomonas sp.]WEK43385.1 MAG: hypothetical protein P0Y64_00570 [Sphingomonas sp.]